MTLDHQELNDAFSFAGMPPPEEDRNRSYVGMGKDVGQ